jgi:hypothetical protein
MNVGLEESDGKMIFKKANLINFENLQLSLFYKGGFAREERMNIQDIIDYVYAEGKIYPKAEPLAEEDDEKNIEYKLKLVDHSIERIEHLTTQMKFRLEEGSGEAFYNLGYEDSGNPLGICKEEVVFSLRNSFINF